MLFMRLINKLGGIIMSIPKELRYSEDHEWVKVEGDKVRVRNY